MKKFIVAPSHAVGRHWCQCMGLSPSEVVLITPHVCYNAHAIREIYVYIFGELFDYPERQFLGYEDFCNTIEEYLK